MENYRDIVVMGLGSASLQLARHFHEDPQYSGKRILFLDPQRQAAKSWCFWHAGSHPMDPWVDFEWKRLHVQSNGWGKVEQPGSYTYRHVSSTQLYHWFFHELLPQHPTWEFRQEGVSHFVEGAQAMSVYTDVNSYEAGQLYDSRLDVNDLHPPLILQHFRGWLVEANDDLFDPQCATFMDFHLTHQEEAPTFVYVLPFSSRTALVETTMFSRTKKDSAHYDAITERYINEKWPNAKLSRTGEENGVIPMAFVKESSEWGSRYKKIGGAAGCIKPTTGYAFNRIHHHLAALMGGGASKKSKRFRFYDRLLLHIIDQRPETVPYIFQRLFKYNPLHRILRFLDEDSSLLEEVRIFATLPFGPFLQALGKQWISKK
jgi:lycopene beta-cyclase